MKIKHKILALIFASSVFFSTNMSICAENNDYSLPESFTFNYYLGKIVRKDFENNSSSEIASNRLRSMRFVNDATISKKKFHKEYERVYKAITYFYKTNSYFNSLSENDKLRDMESFIEYQFNSKTTFEPNTYDIKLAYNAYKSNLFLKKSINKNMQDPISNQDIDFIIKNYDNFRKYMSYLDDYDFCDLLYSITTTINNYNENIHNPWEYQLVKKNDIFKSFFIDEDNFLISTKSVQSYNAKGAVDYAKKYLHSTGPAYYNFENPDCENCYDCANFVSQCLHVGGGMKQIKIDNDKWNNLNWYYKGSGHKFPMAYSASWAKASNFKHHWAKRAGISAHNISLNNNNIYFKTAFGTPISLLNKSTGQARHTIIVGGKRGSNDWWYYDHSGGDFGNSLVARTRGEKIVQFPLTF